MHRLVPLLVALVVAATIGRSVPVFADSAMDVARHIRTTDRRLARLLHQGVRESPAFRTLVARLVRSDVVVYLRCQGYASAGGRLTFIGTAGGYRYVLVQLGRVMSTSRQIALLGHELQHAVEIADTPDIVDAQSLADQYRRFGHVSRISWTSTDYDTVAAIEAGYRVLREMQASVSGE